MSISPLPTTSLPECNSTKILCFGCSVPDDALESALTLNDENDDFDGSLKFHKLSKDQSQIHPPTDVGVVEKVGIVGTVTLLGRSTAMVWVGWGRLQDKHRHDTSATDTNPSTGAASNLLMGPLMVSMPRKSYQGAFATDVPSSKLICESDLEGDLLASQMSERISQQLQMAILVSCHFDDACAPKTNMGIGTNTDIENHMIRRRAMTVAEKKICQLIRQHQLKT